jgi:hypothetical protein
MGTLRIGSVIKVSEWITRNETKRICYGLVVKVDEGDRYRGGYRRKMEVAWGKLPTNPNLRTPRVVWFENTEKWDRCEVVQW